MPARARLAWCAAIIAAATGLFVCYLLQARTYGVNSDGAANVLQAWEMSHGNALLHGWWLSDVSFYTTELPEYALVEAVIGMRPEVVQVSAALTYTLLVLLVVFVAAGPAGAAGASGRQRMTRGLLGGGIMVAPALGYGTYAVLSSPDHTGTGVPVMLLLLLLDRLDPTRLRRYLPLVVLALLAWVQVADTAATLAATIPIALVGALRFARDRSRHDLWLCAAAVVSVPVAAVTLAALHVSGGFYLHPLPGPLLAHPSAWPGQGRWLGQCLLTLFGADVVGQPGGLEYALMLAHMAGVALAVLGLLAGIAGFFGRSGCSGRPDRFGRPADRVSQILVAGVIVVLVAAQFSTAMTSILSVREIAPLLPLSAALAGRVVGARLADVRISRVPGGALSGVLGVVLAGYLAALGYHAAQPASPPENQALADWLWAHNLCYGLAGYWQADSVTLDSGGRVRIAPIFGASPYMWESKSSWYDAGSNPPDFVVTVSSPQAEQMFARPVVISRVFGQPVRVYHFQRYTIDVYDKNVLDDLGVPPPLPASTAIALPRIIR